MEDKEANYLVTLDGDDDEDTHYISNLNKKFHFPCTGVIINNPIGFNRIIYAISVS